MTIFEELSVFIVPIPAKHTVRPSDILIPEHWQVFMSVLKDYPEVSQEQRQCDTKTGRVRDGVG